MVGPELRRRLMEAEFRPFAMVMTDGERIEVKRRDSVGVASIEVGGRRFFASSVQMLDVVGDEVRERVIALSMIAQIVDRHPMNEVNGKH